MSDFKLPDLPSDEELGIAGYDDEPHMEPPGATSEPASPGRSGSPGEPGPQRRAGEPGKTGWLGRLRRAGKGGKPPESSKAVKAPRAPVPPQPPGTHGASRDSDVAGARSAYPWRGPLTLVLLLLLAWGASLRHALPAPVPPDAASTSFASGRAMLTVVEMAAEPRPTGSPANARVRAMLVDRLRALGLEPEVQTATSTVRRGQLLQAAVVRNIVARVPGTASTGAIVLTAHYDSRINARGAGDDATGVAVILETLRALAAAEPLRNDLIVLFTDGEELGLLGARAFVGEHRWMEDVALALSVEMRGGGGPAIMFETGEENGWIVQALAAADPRVVANSLAHEVYARMPNDTDFTPFRDAGVQGLNFAAIGRAHVYHQRYDAPENLDEATLQHHGAGLLRTVAALGQAELGQVRGPERAYFRVPLLGLVTYPAFVAWGLSLLLLLAGAAALVLVRRGGGGWGGVVAGLLASVTLLAAMGAAGWGLFTLVRGRHVEFGTLHGSAFHAEGWYVAALAALALALGALLLALLRRRFNLGALALGAALLPLLAAVGAGFAVPLAAMNLQWPVLLALVGVVIVAGVGPGRRTSLISWLGLLLVGAGVLALLVPLLELVHGALSFRTAPVIGLLAGLIVLLLLPLVDTLRDAGNGWAPALAGLAAVICAAAGAAGAAPGPTRPAPSTLLYVADRDAETARWATRAGPGRAWAEARVGPMQDTVELGDYLLTGAPYLLGAPLPLPGLPQPEVALAGPLAPTPGAAVPLRLTAHSAIGAEGMLVVLEGEEDVAVRRVNGQEVAPEPGAGRLRAVRFWGSPGDTLALELEAGPSVADLAVRIVEHHLRPWELVGQAAFLRPPGLAPDVNAQSDRAVIQGTWHWRLVDGQPFAAARPPPSPTTGGV